MKKIFLIIMIVFAFSSCEDAGVSHLRLTNGNENLPAALKNLKVYSVSLGGGDWVKVALIDGQPNSTTYVKGKAIETVIIINNNDNKSVRMINAKQIISENDSIIVIKK